MTLRHRTMKLGERLDEKARQRAWFEPPSSSEHKQVEFDLPNDPKREFVLSIGAHHRLVPHRDENSAHAANRRSYRALSRRVDQ